MLLAIIGGLVCIAMGALMYAPKMRNYKLYRPTSRSCGKGSAPIKKPPAVFSAGGQGTVRRNDDFSPCFAVTFCPLLTDAWQECRFCADIGEWFFQF